MTQQTEAPKASAPTPLHSFTRGDRVVFTIGWPGCPIPSGAGGRVLRAGPFHLDVRFPTGDFIVHYSRLRAKK